jgi:hypothetical protein
MPKQKITTRTISVREARPITKLKLENYLLTVQWAALVDLRMSLEQRASRRAA